MVDIPKATAIGGTSPDGPRQQHHDGKKKKPDDDAVFKPDFDAPATGLSRSSPRESVSDVAFIMGIPTPEFTPRVEEALGIIMGEFDRQRFELDRSRERIAYLEEQADRHPFLPIINRKAFMRELSVVLTRAEQTATANAYVVLSVIGMESVRLSLGKAARDSTLKTAAEAITNRLRTSDTVGSLGGADFGLIFVLADAAETIEKMEGIEAVLRERLSANEAAPLRFSWGFHIIQTGDTLSRIVEGAERDLSARAQNE